MEFSFVTKEKYRATAIMVVVAVLWSTGGILIKLISWNPLCIASIRGLIASLFILVFMKARGLKLEFSKYTAISAVSVAGCMTLFVVATKMTTAANAIVIQYLSPVWILIISSVIYKQKVSRRDKTAVAVCFCGIVLFFLDKISPGNMIGNVLAIFAGIFLAVLFTANEKAGSDDVRYTGLVCGHFLTFAIGLTGFFITDFHTTNMEIVYILVLGVFQMGLTYALYAYASSRISSLACSLIGMIEPILNPVWVALFYGEQPGRFALAGGIIIIVTLTVWVIQQNRDSAAE
ncbi:MAG: DMT family transporter [Anaerovoracaceae bacterium]|jgi:drug/metabolite transporter (DMT)-like permease